jgi:predicted pyridoxine 5'-phosphate oxidase superfamily flavin-nucleotide-binding protein
VREQPELPGARARYERMEALADPNDALGLEEAAFIAGRDSLYLATVSETGWPYVQHRGGPPGFLKVLSPTRLLMPDFKGNAQYVSVGNAAANDRVALILMDYPGRRRLKILGRLRTLSPSEAGPELLEAAEPRDYRARVERLFVIDVAAFDWNCPQHVTPRYTAAQVEEIVAPLTARIAELERRG